MFTERTQKIFTSYPWVDFIIFRQKIDFMAIVFFSMIFILLKRYRFISPYNNNLKSQTHLLETDHFTTKN